MNSPLHVQLNRPALFSPGEFMITIQVAAKLTRRDITTALARHLLGDWGEVCRHDQIVNEEALKDGDRLHSIYRSESGQEFWIMTEGDRSITTILLPSDY